MAEPGFGTVLLARNTESSADFSLDGPFGQVYCMIVANELHLAGAQESFSTGCIYEGPHSSCDMFSNWRQQAQLWFHGQYNKDDDVDVDDNDDDVNNDDNNNDNNNNNDNDDNNNHNDTNFENQNRIDSILYLKFTYT
ncbi:hypothetical protein Ddye_018296 [Dipteronia dyeriana]|uniref:Uncharacterized protein n=1 Tax=Dipteronia dyeriana TaxID=168575 RepID=A0AAD9X1U5_9ROSI|nr:hypothetical protein Ddye_018296 [Dipteronia dyeriana]